MPTIDPFQDPKYFWKNFRMGTELQLSGSFVYNGLYRFDTMESFYYEEECFEVLYNLSVGLERLFKIAIVLIEHKNYESQEEFEKTLITHNHVDLVNRIKVKHELNLGTIHNKFLSLLVEFYKSTRYERFNLSSVFSPNKDKQKLVAFFEDGLNITIGTDMMNCTEIDYKIKKFMGKIVGKICSQMYEIIRNESYENKTFTYEIAMASKAFKIFIQKTYDFFPERMMQREIFIFLMKSKLDSKTNKILDLMPPMPFGDNVFNEYVRAMMDVNYHGGILGEFESIAEDEGYKKPRIELVGLLGSTTNLDWIKWGFEEE